MEQNKEFKKLQIIRLQENLLSIRKIAGWTGKELGERIGVTKQTISNLENGKSKLLQIQYIAIRSVIDYEIQTNKENTVLPQVISILLDSDDVIDDQKDKEMKTAIGTVAATASGGITGVQLATVAGAVLAPFAIGPLGIIGVAVAGATLGWLNPFMKKKLKINKL